MKALSRINKGIVLFASLSLVTSLVLPLNPAHTYADFTSSPICTLTVDDMNPAAGGVTENITVNFNSGLTSTDQHKWFIAANGVNPSPTSNYPADPVAHTQVLNSTDFPTSFGPYGESAFVSPTTVSESALSGNTYHISASWDASNVENGDTWNIQLTSFDNANDGCQLTTSGNTPTITFRSLVVGSVTVAASSVPVNNSVAASASFTDPNLSNTHTATWNWGDGSTTAGTVTESNGSGSVADSHAYTTTGVYTVTLTVTDSGYNPNVTDEMQQHGVQESSQYQYVTVYNPTPQGLFSAGHQFSSPAGAYPQNSSLTGNVTFGLVYKYQGTVPTSNRQFVMNFKAANLMFNATTVSSLVISNGMATLTGTGTINGSGNYNFLVTGTDGGGIRIQITDPSNNNNVIYDTQPGNSITATPTTSVNGRVIVNS